MKVAQTQTSCATENRIGDMHRDTSHCADKQAKLILLLTLLHAGY
jgi:hypothetical protein